MKYIIEVEVDYPLNENVFECKKECEQGQCPLYVNTGDDHFDGCSISWRNPKSCVVKRKE